MISFTGLRGARRALLPLALAVVAVLGGAPAAGAATTPVTGAPALTNPTLRTVPASIAGNCSTDVTSSLNAWLKAVPDNSRITFPANRGYRVEGSLTLTNRRNLDINGAGSTFKATRTVAQATNRAQWHMDYGSGITLRNMTLRGPHTSPITFGADTGHDHNVFIRGTRAVTITNINGGNTNGEFVAIAQGRDQRTIPGNIKISGTTARNLGRQGISCVACDGVLIENSELADVALHAIDIEVQGNGWPGRNITVRNNRFGAVGWAVLAIGTPYQTTGNDISGITFSGNVQTEPKKGPDVCVPPIQMRSNKTPVSTMTIEGNRLLTHTNGMVLKLVNGATVRNNAVGTVKGAKRCQGTGGLVTDQVTGLVTAGNRWGVNPAEITG